MLTSALPFRALNATSAQGPGAMRDLEGVSNVFTMVITTTGNPTSGTVFLEGSLDGESWVRLDSLTIDGSTNKHVMTADNEHYMRYVRVYLDSLAGGTSPTATVWIATF